MRIRINLTIIIFMAIFCFTNQIKIYMLIMSFCFIHELGHIIMGRILGMQLEKIEIGPCGFSSSFIIKQADFSYEIKKRNNFELKQIIVAITGPIISLILVMIFTYIEIPYITKQEAVYSNILIIIFNLLPLYPLDGGRILKGILYIQLGKEKSEYLIRNVTKITIIILTIISSIAVYYFKNIAIFLVCIFLWSVILQEKNSKTLDILRRK